MPIASVADFIDDLNRFPVLDRTQLQEVAAWDSSYPNAQTLADELVRRGWLTSYQANQLLYSRGAGLVLGSYLLLERIGGGGMGEVFKARHPVMNRVVALKVIRKDLLASADAVQRFRREIRVAAQLDHPHLVRAFDASQEGDVHFLVMEYAEGVNLQDLVRGSGPLPIGSACAYVAQAAMGLQYAAERRLLHRDIKPSNLQVTKNGAVVKIVDMGLARVQDSDPDWPDGITQAGATLGTPDYVAPEQIVDPRRVDIRADIYSLGCVFYFLLAGRPPFPDRSLEEKLASHRQEEPELIERLRPDVPAAVASILRRMMAKAPRDRYAPAAVVDALLPFSDLRLGLAATSVRAIGGAAPTVTQRTETMTAPASAPATMQAPPTTTSSVAPLADRPTAEPDWSLPVSSSVPAPPPTVVAANVAAPPVPLASRPPAPPASIAEPTRKKWWLLGAGVGFLGVIALAVLFWPKGDGAAKDKDDSLTLKAPPAKEKEAKGAGKKGMASEAVLDEDFHDPEATGSLPKGWTGDRLILATKDEAGRACLRPVSASGRHFVGLPPFKVEGNFFFEVEAKLISSNVLGQMTVRLWSSVGGPSLYVTVDPNGVAIAKNEPAEKVTTKQKKMLPIVAHMKKASRYVIVREGKAVRVLVNDEPAAAETLDSVIEYDMASISLTPSRDYLPRIYRVKLGKGP
ncbi:MAG: protein kinase [Gemmataceae bacterium]